MIEAINETRADVKFVDVSHSDQKRLFGIFKFSDGAILRLDEGD